VKIVRTGFGLGDEEGKDAFGFDGDDIILILQNAFDHEKAFGDQQKAIFVEQVGMDDRIGDSGFIFEAEEEKAFGGAGTLASDDAASDAEALTVSEGFERRGGADA